MILAGLAASLLIYLLQSDPRSPKRSDSPVADQPAAPTPTATDPPTSAEPLEPYVVQIVGEDFRWHFQVLEPTVGKVSSVLRLPAGRRIHWQLTSADYIYAFRIPQLQINMMAVPRLTSTTVTETTQSVTLDLLVDPLCSFRLYHDEWMGRVEITEDRS